MGLGCTYWHLIMFCCVLEAVREYARLLIELYEFSIDGVKMHLTAINSRHWLESLLRLVLTF